MLNPNLTPEILAAALQGLEAQRARLDAHIAEVRRMLDTQPQQPAAPAEAPRPKRKLSAAGRRRIVEAAKKRWAAHHRMKAEAAQTAKEPAVAKKAAPKKVAAKKTAKKTAARELKTTVAEAATQPAAAGRPLGRASE
jgi:septum formation inhibitor MinC